MYKEKHLVSHIYSKVATYISIIKFLIEVATDFPRTTWYTNTYGRILLTPYLIPYIFFLGVGIGHKLCRISIYPFCIRSTGLRSVGNYLLRLHPYKSIPVRTHGETRSHRRNTVSLVPKTKAFWASHNKHGDMATCDMLICSKFWRATAYNTLLPPVQRLSQRCHLARWHVMNN